MMEYPCPPFELVRYSPIGASSKSRRTGRRTHPQSKGPCFSRYTFLSTLPGVPTQNVLPINHAFGRSAMARSLSSCRRDEELDSRQHRPDIPPSTPPARQRSSFTVRGWAPRIGCITHLQMWAGTCSGIPAPSARSDLRAASPAAVISSSALEGTLAEPPQGRLPGTKDRDVSILRAEPELCRGAVANEPFAVRAGHGPVPATVH
jgi:hypothetical protein